MKRIQKAAAAVVVNELNQVSKYSINHFGYFVDCFKHFFNEYDGDASIVAKKIQHEGYCQDVDCEVVEKTIANTVENLRNGNIIVPDGEVAFYINKHLGFHRDELKVLREKFVQEEKEILSVSVVLTPEDSFQEPKKNCDSSCCNGYYQSDCCEEEEEEEEE